jgi:archaellum component FlaC
MCAPSQNWFESSKDIELYTKRFSALEKSAQTVRERALEFDDQMGDLYQTYLDCKTLVRKAVRLITETYERLTRYANPVESQGIRDQIKAVVKFEELEKNFQELLICAALRDALGVPQVMFLCM